MFASRTKIRHGPFAQPTPPTSRRYYLRWKRTRAATVSSCVESCRVESCRVELHVRWKSGISGQRLSLLGQSPHRQVFLEVLFACWGMPTTITTDNGPQFISADFTTFLSEWRIRHIRTAFYNPQANGGVERMNPTLKNGIRAHLAEGFQFSAELLRTLLHYRATRHTTTDSSPALLMLGRELSLPLDRLRVPAHLTSQGA